MKCTNCAVEIPIQQGQCPNCGVIISPVARASFGKRHPAVLISITLAAFLVIAGFIGGVGYKLINSRAASHTGGNRGRALAPRQTEYPVEHGESVRPEELHGHGQLYFVPVGSQVIPAQSLADYYHDKFGTEITVLPQVSIRPEDCVPQRRQCVAEELEAEMTTAYPEIARNRDSVMIALTDEDIFPRDLGWRFTYSLHSARFGIVSTHRVDPGFWQGPHNEEARLASTKQMLTKYVAMLYYHLPDSFDPSSVMYTPLTPDGGPDDLHESDLHSDSTPNGLRGTGFPCLAFAYSFQTHAMRAVDPEFADCRHADLAHADEETFEINLGLGRMTERSLDLQLDSAPMVEFRRAYLSDFLRPLAMGIGGNHSFNTYLTSDGASALTYTSIVHEDGLQDYLARISGGRGFNSNVIFESRDDGMRGARMTWDSGHFKLRYRDGAWATFLPCSDARCYWVGYQDSKGNSLRFWRSPRLDLQKVMAEGDQGIQFQSDDQVRITEAKATDGRTVEYEYDPAGCLARVHRTDGQTVLYTYDSGHHMTSVAVIRKRGAKPEEIAAFEYDAKGRITKQTTGGIGVYQIEYLPTADSYISELRVTDPEGQVFRVSNDSQEYVVHAQSVRFPRILAQR